jgi:hypothetical protein
MTYLLRRTKPAGNPLPRSRYALSRTRGLDRGAVRQIITNTDLFVLKFGAHLIYMYTSLYLQSQTIRTCISCPVEDEFGDQDPKWSHNSSHDRCRISEFWAPKWSELGHRMQNLKNSFIRVFHSNKLCIHINLSHHRMALMSIGAWGMIYIQ